MAKRSIYLAQVNNTYGKGAFLPYSVGLLQAYAQKFPEITDHYEFKELLFLREPVEEVAERWQDASVVGISCYIWNAKFSLALAKAIRKVNSECVIVLGGPHVPNDSVDFLAQHNRYVDICVHGEGEETFKEILVDLLDERSDWVSWLDIDGISFWPRYQSHYKTKDRARAKDLEQIPSPYLTGVFDGFPYGKYEFHPTQETHRGCPFQCTFCDWGSNLMSKVSKFSDERLQKEIDWFADHKIDLLYNADANWAMFERDIELTRYMVQKKKETGFPNKFRAAYAKNSCLAGDTLVDTVYGIMPIKEIAEKYKEIGIFTYDRKQRQVRVATAKNIEKTGENEKLVRVWFDDGTWIDCTPDHKFLVFAWAHKKDWKVKAENLKPGMHVRAVRMQPNGKMGYIRVEWGGRKNYQFRHRMIMEWILGRSLEKKEVIHHKDHNPVNNHPDNLQLCASTKEHMQDHPELAERMSKLMKGRKLPKWWGRAISEGKRGKKHRPECSKNHSKAAKLRAAKRTPEERSEISRKAMATRRARGLPIGNPNWVKRKKRTGNHVIVAVTPLKGRHDVYCMEVPDTHWFYANNVLVHNSERVYTVSKMLNDAGMSKGATLSFQSMDDNTLTIIKRKNIGVEVFKNLMQRYRKESIPTYSELIVGLPGETYDSFADGIDKLIECGQHDSIQCYSNESLPNSEQNQPEYRERYGIKTVEVPVLFFHGTPTEDPHQEMYELVIETNTLSTDDWIKCHMLSWAVQTFHCLGLTQAIAVFRRHMFKNSYRFFYESLLKYAEQRPNTLLGRVTSEVKELFTGIPKGKPWGIIDNRFGNITWPPEEGAFLKFSAESDQFYDELREWQIGHEIINYQQVIAKTFRGPKDIEVSWDIPKYLQDCYEDKANPRESSEACYYGVNRKDYASLEEYAKEVVWFGRKGGSFLYQVEKLA